MVAALLAHPAARECGVVRQPDPERGMLVTAHIVLDAGCTPEDAMAKTLQDHVKAEIPPYKYQRRVIFSDTLPRIGKLQRFALGQA